MYARIPLVDKPVNGQVVVLRCMTPEGRVRRIVALTIGDALNRKPSRWLDFAHRVSSDPRLVRMAQASGQATVTV